MSADDASAAMLSEMSACAYRLGMALGCEAERVEAWERKLELFNLFDRCFFSVRVATALQLRLQRSPAAASPRTEVSDAATLPEPADPPETEAPGRERLDADREREAEGVSLPILLKTLQGVATDACALPGPPPAELPTLRELLARVTQAPAPVTRPQASGLRTRLAGSATAAVATLSPPSARPEARLPLPRLPLRAATGPPRR
ncbi:MAG TPA: hypothetical protein VF474_13320 [Phenylobacterium sp.]